MTIKEEAMQLYPVDQQVIETADGHQIFYDENEGQRAAYETGREKSESEIKRLQQERTDLIKQLREFISMHETGLLPNRFTYEDSVVLLNGIGE